MGISICQSFTICAGRFATFLYHAICFAAFTWRTCSSHSSRRWIILRKASARSSGVLYSLKTGLSIKSFTISSVTILSFSRHTIHLIYLTPQRYNFFFIYARIRKEKSVLHAFCKFRIDYIITPSLVERAGVRFLGHFGLIKKLPPKETPCLSIRCPIGSFCMPTGEHTRPECKESTDFFCFCYQRFGLCHCVLRSKCTIGHKSV